MSFAEPVPSTSTGGEAVHEDSTAKDLPAVLHAGDVVMLTTEGPAGLESRPVTCAEASEVGFHCLVDRRAAWTQPLLAMPAPMNAARADARKNDYVSMTGEARVVTGHEEVRRLWSPPAEAFFDGPDDPRAAVLEVVVSSGQWWSGPSGRVAQVLSLVRAAVSDQPGNVGEQGALAPASDLTSSEQRP